MTSLYFNIKDKIKEQRDVRKNKIWSGWQTEMRNLCMYKHFRRQQHNTALTQASEDSSCCRYKNCLAAALDCRLLSEWSKLIPRLARRRGSSRGRASCPPGIFSHTNTKQMLLCRPCSGCYATIESLDAWMELMVSPKYIQIHEYTSLFWMFFHRESHCELSWTYKEKLELWFLLLQTSPNWSNSWLHPVKIKVFYNQQQ